MTISSSSSCGLPAVVVIVTSSRREHPAGDDYTRRRGLQVRQPVPVAPAVTRPRPPCQAGAVSGRGHRLCRHHDPPPPPPPPPPEKPPEKPLPPPPPTKPDALFETQWFVLVAK